MRLAVAADAFNVPFGGFPQSAIRELTLVLPRRGAR
jgi:hypothetical protein